MTAQSQITGYLTPEDMARVNCIRRQQTLTVRGAVDRISRMTGVPAGDILGRSKARKIVRARHLAWALAHRHGISFSAIARESGFGESTVQAACHALKAENAGRSGFRLRGILGGVLEAAVLAGPAAAQDALERRCAKTGETMAEALVAFWAEAHK